MQEPTSFAESASYRVRFPVRARSVLRLPVAAQLRRIEHGKDWRVNLRRLAELMSRGIVWRRRLPREFQKLPLYVSPEASLRYWRPNLATVDPMLFDMAREMVKVGHVVWDVGANVGLFSFCASALAGPSGSVLAIEPDFWLAHLLTCSARGLSRSHCGTVAPVAVVCGAVADHTGISKFQIAERGRAANHLAEIQGSSQVGGNRYLQQTITVSLDFLLEHFPPPSVLKIDAEAAEVRILQGSQKLLSTARPIIWCEVSPENSEAVANLLHEHGYEIYAAALRPDERTALHRASWNTLAIPQRPPA
jgi:FkbM family methyltransferase